MSEGHNTYSVAPGYAGTRTKRAYGGDADGFEWDRWYDGGAPWSPMAPKGTTTDPELLAQLTRLFAEAAERQGASVRFSGEQYAEPEREYDVEEAIARILASKKLDLMNPDLPHYYTMQYPRKPRQGLLERLRLRQPGPVDEWPEDHPVDLAVEGMPGGRPHPLKMASMAAPGYFTKQAFNPAAWAVRGIGHAASSFGGGASRAGRLLSKNPPAWATRTAGAGMGAAGLYGGVTAARYPGARERGITQGYMDAFSDTNMVDRLRMFFSPQFREHWQQNVASHYLPTRRSSLRSAMPFI